MSTDGLAAKLASLSPAQRKLLLEKARQKSLVLAEPEPPLAPIPAAERDAGDLPLSLEQERLWLLEQVESGSHLAAWSGELELAGPLAPAALDAALGAVVARHEALHLAVALAQGSPRGAAVADRASLAVVDLTALPDAAAGGEADRLAAGRAGPFDLAAGQLLAARLLRLSPELHRLHLSVHRIAADENSLALVLGELAQIYSAAVADEPVALAPLLLQHADAVWHHRRRLAGERGKAFLAYWRGRLTPPPAPLPLPFDRPRGTARSGRGGRSRRLLAVEREAVAALAQAHDAEAWVVVLAAFMALLARWTGQVDVAVGWPSAGREREGLAEIVGPLADLLVVRAEVRHDLPFAAVLERVAAAVRGAAAHADMPFELLVEELKPDHDPALTPFVQVSFAEVSPAPPLVFAGLAAGPWELAAVAELDLEWSLISSGGALAVETIYARDLFAAATVERFLGQLDLLLAGAVADPALALAALPLLSSSEREELLALGRPAEVPALSGTTLHALVAVQAALTPAATALVWGTERLPYAELERRANRLARHLQATGRTGAERTIGVRLARTPDLIVALLAVLKTGSAYLPIDPAYPADRAAFLLDDAGAGLLVTRRDLARPAGFDPRALEVLLDAEAAAITTQADAPCPERPGEDELEHHLAYLIYTSGSTGRPKGVAIEHASAVRLVAWAAREFTPAELAGVLGATSVNFDLSVFEIFATLALGGTLILADNALALPSLPAGTEVTLVNTVPAAMAALLDLGPLPPSVATVCLAGEPLRRALADRVWAAGARRLLNLYGPSEDTTYSTGTEIPAGAAGEPDIGRPLAGSTARVLGAGLDLQPLGIPGELCLSGFGLARGYWRRAALTAERFVPDPWSPFPGGRLYRTGDLARLTPEGALEYLGRLDHQVKIRGFRIELDEVEAALAAHPALRESVVIVREDRPGDRCLAAYAVAVAGAAVEPAEVRERLRGQLPEFMVPSFLTVLAELPQTSTGKIDRQALARLPAPGTAGLSLAPRNETEAAVAAVWCQVLGRDNVGVNDNFFDVGGHSLLSVKVHGLLAKRYPKLELLDLFRYPTVAALASFLTPAPEAVPAAVRVEPPPRPAASGAVAIVGMAGRFPGAADVESFWDNLVAGVEAVSRLPEPPAGTAPPGYVPAAALLEGFELFDAGFFGFTPREAEATDPQHRLFLECAWAALESAGCDPAAFPGPAGIGVFAGSGINSYLGRLFSHPEVIEALGPLRSLIASDKDYLATRVSYKLGLTGPSLTVQSACSTSLVAVHLACRSLWAGECDLAIAGGSSVHNLDGQGYAFEEGGIYSPDGHCRAFDVQARGTVPGDGVAAVVLKRLEDALADGDTIVAVVRGSGINNDGADKVGYTAPGMEGQTKVIRAAWQGAGIDPATVGYVEAHGTGTPLGDPIEVAALSRALAPARERRTFPCLLGSVKSNVGHLDTAAGVAGLIKAALAVERGVVPPSLHFTAPGPQIDLSAGPFEVAAALSPFPASPGEPRRAGVSSFGIGGTNAHVLIEQAPAAAEPAALASPWQLYLLSARTAEALERATDRLASHLERHAELAAADVAHTLRVGRRGFEHRRAVVAASLAEAREALAARDAERVLSGVAPGPTAVAFLFPGQGAQRAGMGQDLYAAWPVFRAEIDRAAEILAPHLGLDLRALLYPEEAEAEAAAARLAETRFTQPALFAVEYALARLWQSWGVAPVALLGHSVGEYVAACLAGVFSLEDALALIALRGRLVFELPPGAMLSVPLAEADLALSPELSVAAVNAPDRTVVAGPVAAIEAWAAELAGRGLDVRRLDTSHAFHSAMMEPAVAALTAAVARVERQAPRIPFLSNLSGRWIGAEEATDPAYWGRHLRQPVRFAEGVATLLASGQAGACLEVGPGEALIRLARREARSREASLVAASTLPARAAETAEEAHLLRSVGRLWLAGVAFDWQGFAGGARRRRLPLPTYPFERRRFWLDARPLGPAAGPEEMKVVAPASSEPAAAGRRPGPPDRFYLPSFRRSLPPHPALPVAGRWLLFADPGAPAAALANRLRAAGSAVTLVTEGKLFGRQADGSYTLRPTEAADYEALLAQVGAAGALTGALHLWTFGPARPLRLDDLDAALARGPLSVLLLGRALALDPRPFEIRVVSSFLHDLGGGEAVHPERAALLGLLRTLPLEIPDLVCRSLDLVPGEGGEKGAVDRILAEMAAGLPDPAVAYRGRQRWVPCFEPVHLAPGSAAARLRPDGVYLVSGGLSGIGYEIAKALAAPGVRLALIWRTPLPPREEWARAVEEGGEAARRIAGILALEAQGAEVEVFAADVGKRYQMERVREQVRARFKSVHGVVHALGASPGRPVTEEEAATATEALAAKVKGALVLAEIFPTHELDFLLLGSSLGAVTGAPGQAAGAAADAFLDAFAAAHPGVSSIGWDRFTPEEERTALSPAEVADAFGRILAHSSLPQLLVAKHPLAGAPASLPAAPPEEDAAPTPPAAPQATGRHPRPELPTAYAAPRDEAEEKLAAIWADLLGLDHVGIHDDFFELGGDSVLGLRIAARTRELGYTLEPGRIFEKPTIAALAALLAGAAPASAETAAATPETSSPVEKAAPKPEDFPDAEISQSDLATLLAQLEED